MGAPGEGAGSSCSSIALPCVPAGWQLGGRGRWQWAVGQAGLAGPALGLGAALPPSSYVNLAEPPPPPCPFPAQGRGRTVPDAVEWGEVARAARVSVSGLETPTRTHAAPSGRHAHPPKPPRSPGLGRRLPRPVRTSGLEGGLRKWCLDLGVTPSLPVTQPFSCGSSALRSHQFSPFPERTLRPIGAVTASLDRQDVSGG